MLPQAEAALAAGMAQPWHADTVALPEPGDTASARFDRTDDLVPRNERRLGVAQVAVDDMEVGAAHATSRYGNAHLTRSRLGHRHAHRAQRQPRALEQHRSHGLRHGMVLVGALGAGSALDLAADQQHRPGGLREDAF